MKKEELAAKLTGREYGEEITEQECKEAKKEGLVVVFGYSDDNAEFRGAIHDEVGAYDDTFIPVTKEGILQNECEDEDCPYFAKLEEKATKIHAIYDEEGYSWIYKTDIPHATFDIMEDGEKYCRGIVFALSDTEAK